MFLEPETSQETGKKPKSPSKSYRRPPKTRLKTTKKKDEKCLRGKKCLKPAISFLRVFGNLFWSHFLLIFKLIVYIMFFTTFLKLLKLILKPILGSERPKRAKMNQKEPSGASKNQKPSFSKTLKNQRVF